VLRHLCCSLATLSLLGALRCAFERLAAEPGQTDLTPIWERMSFATVEPSELHLSADYSDGLEMPLAAAPLTRYLGHALFLDRPNASEFSESARLAPQMFVYQFLLRGLCILPPLSIGRAFPLMTLWLIPFVRSPYLNEIILLERNPFFSSTRAG